MRLLMRREQTPRPEYAPQAKILGASRASSLPGRPDRGFPHVNDDPQRWKQTPTHIAAKRGDVALVKVLAESEKFPVAAHKEDTKGRTPLAVVVGDAPKAAIADIVGPAAVATPVPGNKVAPEQ